MFQVKISTKWYLVSHWVHGVINELTTKSQISQPSGIQQLISKTGVTDDFREIVAFDKRGEVICSSVVHESWNQNDNRVDVPEKHRDHEQR